MKKIFCTVVLLGLLFSFLWFLLLFNTYSLLAPQETGTEYVYVLEKADDQTILLQCRHSTWRWYPYPEVAAHTQEGDELRITYRWEHREHRVETVDRIVRLWPYKK